MKPSIGRIVHYNGVLRGAAAIVINVREDETIDLQVFFQDGDIEKRTKVSQGETIGTWNWPPKL